jgi:hypothetical protein
MFLMLGTCSNIAFAVTKLAQYTTDWGARRAEMNGGQGGCVSGHMSIMQLVGGYTLSSCKVDM